MQNDVLGIRSLVVFCVLCCSDEDTITLMKTPRCSLPDQDKPSQTPSSQWRVNMKRRRRAISTWTNRNINWRLGEKNDYDVSYCTECKDFSLVIFKWHSLLLCLAYS